MIQQVPIASLKREAVKIAFIASKFAILQHTI
jgi:hypothetical protein